MSDILKLQPESVWKNFYALTQIPRPSKSEEKIRNFLHDYGKNLGLETIIDEVGNVIIRKPATKGMENRKGVVMQAHMDMVPQKNSDKIHDFTTDPLEPWIDGDWVRAKGTTLGSDNGIGLSAALSVLESKDLAHGPIEVLVTTDEETGMTGAFGLKPGFLKSDILLNLDSEDEGELYVGCAGGVNANMKLKYTETAIPANTSAFKLHIKGLKGGHSGLDINMGRGNSNKIMFRFLKKAQSEVGLCLATAEGGNLRNAIPRESVATVLVPTDHVDKFKKMVAEYEALVKSELAATEPTFSLSVESTVTPSKMMDSTSQSVLINSVYGCPNGVIRISDAMPGLIETSTNLAIVKAEKGEAEVICLLRSSVNSAKEDLCQMIDSVFALAGAEVEFSGDYPGWRPNINSEILNLMKSIYEKKYGKIPEVKAIHAGLECGLLGDVYPNWDMISFGPTIRHPHSPDEKVNVPSVQKFWDFLVETLKNVPVKN